MLVYRICHKNYTELAPSGVDGRWISGGRAVIYCAQSLELALLENMVRRQGLGFNDEFRTLVIEIPTILKVELVNLSGLPAGWNGRDYAACQAVGNKWYDAMRVPVLKVPSAILSASHNYILNTRHPGFNGISLKSKLAFIPDERIEDILKRYKKP
jgi:RES domain-containing protein